jgi:dipeptidyl-peptidase-4
VQPRALIIVSLWTACCVQPSAAQSAVPGNTLTIESIFADGSLTGRGPENIQWSPDNSRLSYVQRDDSGDHGELCFVNALTGEKGVLVSEQKLSTLSPSVNQIKDEREKERLRRYNVAAYLWSPDSKHLIFNSQGQLWYYTLETGTGVQVTSAPEPASDPKFSPDGNRLAYLRKHNLYVRSISGGEEKQLTKDKDENLLDGEADWVYSEELGVRSNYFWSPNGKDIAYLQMDETHVPSYPITDWSSVHAKVDQEKYPQPGDPNPAVRLGVVSSSGGGTRWISLAGHKSDDDADNSDSDVYIPRFGWLRDGILWAQVINRAQNKTDIYFIDAHSGRSRRVLIDSDPDGWVYASDNLRFLKSSPRFLWSSWRDGHTHLYLYSFNGQDPLAADAHLDRQLTQGDFEVLGLDGLQEAGLDEASGVVYFTSNRSDQLEHEIDSVKLDGSGLQRISQPEGMHGAMFPEDGKHYLDNFSATLTPPSMSLCTPGGSCQKFWEARSVESYSLTAPKFLDFKADDGTTLHGSLLLPPENSRSGKIPLIVYIYGGPAGQTVSKGWIGTRGLFHQLMARDGFAIFTVDNRGTPGRDRKFQTAIHHEFGAIELKDQLTALDQLFAQYPQLDRTRIAIWGWSNGGSMTAYALTHSDAYKAGVSVAPVTDWRLYDSIYTERYMGLPKDNAKAYDDSSMPAAAANLHGSLLLVHGTSDDNVHMQNSIQMMDALQKAGKQFRFMAYPGKTHGIAGSGTQKQLFHMIQDFLEQELGH